MSKTLSLIGIGLLIVGISAIIIRTILYQRQFGQHLPLSKHKNKQVIIKQISLLAVSVFAFALVLKPPLTNLPLTKEKGILLVSESPYKDVLESYFNQSSVYNLESETLDNYEIELLGQFELNNQNYQLVKVDDHYYLIDEAKEQVLELAHP